MKHCLTLDRVKALTDDSVLLAILYAESAFDAHAMRYEKNFRHVFKVVLHAKENAITLETEAVLQRFSFGLGQIMGGRARELGFRGNLTELLDPVVNVQYAEMHFRSKLDLYNGHVESAIMAYNSGSVLKSERGKKLNMEYLYRVRAAERMLAERGKL